MNSLLLVVFVLSIVGLFYSLYLSLDEIRSLRDKNSKLRGAIIKHCSNRGHSLCWENDEELWSVLEDGRNVFPHETVPSTPEFLSNCVDYCGKIRQNEPSDHVELRKKIKRMCE